MHGRGDEREPDFKIKTSKRLLSSLFPNFPFQIGDI